MPKASLYSTSTKTASSIELPADFKGEVNDSLIAQAIHVYRSRSHIGVVRTKTRGEVTRTTKKWYRQKGTGNARHGARSAPIFVGGGVAHGPDGRVRTLRLPVKMRANALKSVLSFKAKRNEVVFADKLDTLKQTKDAKAFLARVADKDSKNQRFTFILSDGNKEAARFVRNLENVRAMAMRDLNPFDAYFGGTLVFDAAIYPKNKAANKKTAKPRAKKEIEK